MANNFQKFQSLPPEEQERLKQEMFRALQPHRPSDGLIDPMVKPDGSAFFGEEPVYPYFPPNADGTINPVVFAADFINGPPPDLTYQPGYTIPGTSFGGCPLGTVRYSDESLNLPLGLSALSASAPGDLVAQAVANHLYQKFSQLQQQFALPPLPRSEDFVRYDPDKKGLNFSAVPTHIGTVHRGNELTRFLCLDAFCGKETMPFTHKLSDLQSLPSALIRAFPSCDLGGNPAKNGQELVSDLRSKLPGLPEHHAYLTPGWADVAGIFLYVHDGATPPRPEIFFETGLRIPVDHTLSRTDAFRSALGFLNISPRLEVTLPLLLFAYLGPLFTPFELAGCPPQVVLFVHGRTGSLKTATTSLVYNLFQEKPAISATFKDTAAALEIKIGTHKDRILLVDDYHPPVGGKGQRAMQETLEHVVRLYGDGIAKSRSTATLERMREFVPHGLCAITGEDTGGSQSSLLRCLQVVLELGDISGVRLQSYQDTPALWTSNFHYFLEWCCGNYQTVAAIISTFTDCRAKYQGFLQERRSASTGAWLELTAQLLLHYGVDIGALNHETCEALFTHWQETIAVILKTSEEVSAERDPVVMYLSALREMMDDGSILIADNDAAFADDKRGYFGVYRDTQLLLHPARTYERILAYYRRGGTTFPLEKERMHAALFEAKVIQCQRDGIRNGKTKISYQIRTSFPGRPRMLCIDLAKMDQILETE